MNGLHDWNAVSVIERYRQQITVLTLTCFTDNAENFLVIFLCAVTAPVQEQILPPCNDFRAMHRRHCAEDIPAWQNNVDSAAICCIEIFFEITGNLQQHVTLFQDDIFRNKYSHFMAVRICAIANENINMKSLGEISFLYIVATSQR